MPVLTNKSKLVTAVIVVAAIAASVMVTMYGYRWRCGCMWEEENCKKALNPVLWLQGGGIPQQAAVVTSQTFQDHKMH